MSSGFWSSTSSAIKEVPLFVNKHRSSGHRLIYSWHHHFASLLAIKVEQSMSKGVKREVSDIVGVGT